MSNDTRWFIAFMAITGILAGTAMYVIGVTTAVRSSDVEVPGPTNSTTATELTPMERDLATIEVRVRRMEVQLDKVADEVHAIRRAQIEAEEGWQ